MKKYAVIGTGNGGQAIAGWLSMKGYFTTLYGRNRNVVDQLNQCGCIKLRGCIDGIGSPDIITDNLETAIEKSDIIMVTTTANAHSELAQRMAPSLRDGQFIVLNPGRTGGALEFKARLRSAGCNAEILVAEAQTLLYACRLIEPGVVNIIGVKENVLLSAIPASQTQKGIDMIKDAFPCFIPAHNVLHTSLENIGAMFHPCVLLFNAATIERQNEFWFYRDMTPRIAAFIESLDAERIAVGKAYGVELLNVNDWISFAYPGTKGETLCEKMINNPAYWDIKSPSTIFTRQLTEDIPTGIVPIMQLGNIAGVPVPLMESIVKVSSSLLGIDFYREGRTLEKLGLEGLSKEQVKDYLTK